MAKQTGRHLLPPASGMGGHIENMQFVADQPGAEITAHPLAQQQHVDGGQGVGQFLFKLPARPGSRMAGHLQSCDLLQIGIHHGTDVHRCCHGVPSKMNRSG